MYISEITCTTPTMSQEPVRWPFESLRQSSPPGCFYAASSCALHMRRPLNFPGSMWISNNYFDPKWSGDRRMKNVVMVLEWCPSRAAVALSASPMASPAESAKMDLKRVLELYLFDRASKGQQPLTPELVEQLVCSGRSGSRMRMPDPRTLCVGFCLELGLPEGGDYGNPRRMGLRHPAPAPRGVWGI